jgi:hypothetical protein
MEKNAKKDKKDQSINFIQFFKVNFRNQKSLI